MLSDLTFLIEITASRETKKISTLKMKIRTSNL